MSQGAVFDGSNRLKRARRLRPRAGYLLVAVVASTLCWCGPASAAPDPVIAAAGDIACDPKDGAFNGGLGTATACHELHVSNLMVGRGLQAVLPLGDLQYGCGGLSAFGQSYEPSWGRLKSLSFPVPGNHEYMKSGGTGCDSTGKAKGYFAYFGGAAGDPAKGYYSYDIGAWHLVALNTNLNCGVVACSASSQQVQWLKADLAAHPNDCTLAYFHYPVFSSVEPISHGKPFWQALYDAGADVVLNGHVHVYERFAPQTPAAAPDPANGIREFVVGTGGRFVESFLSTVATNSEVRSRTFGVLELTLRPTGYEWRFVPDGTIGNTFTETGVGACHGAPGAPDTIPPTVALTAPLDGETVSGAITVSATAADVGGVDRVEFLVDGALIGSDSTAPYSAQWDSATAVAGSHVVSAEAIDAAGNRLTAAATVNGGTRSSSTPPGGGSPAHPVTAGRGAAGVDLYRVRVGGAGSRRLTGAADGVAYDAPAWSHDGRLIAAGRSECPACPSELVLVDAAGTQERRVGGAPAGASSPDWRRRDRAIAFVDASTGAVGAIGSDGRGLRRVTAGQARYDGPVWAPDGRRIAAMRRQRNGGWDVVLMRLDGTVTRNLTGSPGTEVDPAWSHDGRRVAFARRVRGRWAVFATPATGGPARRISSPALGCRQPAWSPDDRRIACAASTRTGSSIVVMRDDGTRARRLRTGTATAWAPTWSPSGRDIAFASRG